MTIKNKILRIATRKSALALWQANTVKALLEKEGQTVELNLVVTTGDKMQRGALAEISLDDKNLPDHLKTGKGLFVKEVQEEILSGQADLAVHSMKDLPVETTKGLRTAAVLPRANPHDVIIFSPSMIKRLKVFLGEYPLSRPPEEIFAFLSAIEWTSNTPIGTTSARRQSFLRHAIPATSHSLQTLRGNVDTRLKRVNSDEFSFIMLARAGLDRLGLYDPDSMLTLPSTLSTPAPAQGIVAIECRNDDLQLREILSKLNNIQSSLDAAMERSALWLTGGDCHTAFAAFFENGCLDSWAALEFKRATVKLILDQVERETWLQCASKFDHTELFKQLLRSTTAQKIHTALCTSGYDKLMTLRSPQN